MEHQLEELVIPYAQEVFGDEVVVKPYLEGMFYNYSTGMDIKEYLRDNNPPILLYVFIKSNKEELSSEDNANIKLFLEKITEFKYTDIGCTLTPVSNSYPALVISSYKIIVVKNDKEENR